MTRICYSRNAEARMTEGYRWIIRVNFQSPGNSIILCQMLTIFNLISLFFPCNSFGFRFFLCLYLLTSVLWNCSRSPQMGSMKGVFTHLFPVTGRRRFFGKNHLEVTKNLEPGRDDIRGCELLQIIACKLCYNFYVFTNQNLFSFYEVCGLFTRSLTHHISHFQKSIQTKNELYSAHVVW